LPGHKITGGNVQNREENAVSPGHAMPQQRDKILLSPVNIRGVEGIFCAVFYGSIISVEGY